MPCIRYDSQINVQTGSYTLTTPTFNASSVTFNISLDPASITRPGVYAMVKATTISNLSSTIANATFDGSSPLKVRQIFRNSSVKFSDGTFDCILVRMG